MPTLGVDWGAKRVGIALSSSDLLATPLGILPNEGDLVAALIEIGERESVDRFVVGLPRVIAETPETRRITIMVDELRQRSCKEVFVWDESYSTVEAESRRRSRGESHKRKRHLDDQAAAVMLQTWLDEKGGSDR